MGRLPRYSRDELDDRQVALFDRIAAGEVKGKRPRFSRRGPDNALEGPYNARLLNPEIGSALYDLSVTVRRSSTLQDRTTELMIVHVARALDSEYQLLAHKDIARAAGVRDDEIAAAEAGDVTAFVGIDRAALKVAVALTARGDLDDAEYAEAVAVLGERALFECSTLVGICMQTAMQLRIFRVELPAEV
jgi:4-carboxymuconolactone decarboxylase